MPPEDKAPDEKTPDEAVKDEVPDEKAPDEKAHEEASAHDNALAHDDDKAVAGANATDESARSDERFDERPDEFDGGFQMSDGAVPDPDLNVLGSSKVPVATVVPATPSQTTAMVQQAAAVIAAAVVGGTVDQCSNVGSAGGDTITCDVTIENNFTYNPATPNTPTGLATITTSTNCTGSALGSVPCAPGGPVVVTSTTPITTITQCNGSGLGGASTITCTVTVTNNLNGYPTGFAIDSTVKQCQSPGAVNTLTCVATPPGNDRLGNAGPGGQAIIQCNESGGAGGTMTCTATAPPSQSTGLPTTIRQCQKSGQTGASTVTCTATITNNFTNSIAPLPVAPGPGGGGPGGGGPGGGGPGGGGPGGGGPGGGFGPGPGGGFGPGPGFGGPGFGPGPGFGGPGPDDDGPDGSGPDADGNGPDDDASNGSGNPGPDGTGLGVAGTEHRLFVPLHITADQDRRALPATGLGVSAPVLTGLLMLLVGAALIGAARPRRLARSSSVRRSRRS